MSKLKQIIRLRVNGTPIKTISKNLGISKNTVKKYLRLIEVKEMDFKSLLSKEDYELEFIFDPPDPESTQRYSQLKPFFPYMVKELSRVGVDRWVLWGEYKRQYPSGYSYSHFCYLFDQWRQTTSAVMHIDHHPADKMFIDFTGKKLHIIDRDSGEVIPVEVYVAALGYSQMAYVQACHTQQKQDFISCTEKAIHFFGGVPKALVPDNLKSAVHKANKYEAELNESFRDMANHYNTAVLPARSNKPRDKAIVENTVKQVYRRIFAPLRNRQFFSLQQLNEAIAELLASHNKSLFQGECYSRQDRFDADEKPLLQPLPQDRYEIREYLQLTVMKNSHIRLKDKHYYSIPYRYIGKKVKVVYSASNVAVYYKSERIAFHTRSYKRHGYTTVKDHLPSTHQFVLDWNPQRFIRWATAIDPAVKQVVEQVLESKAYPEQTYRSCAGILSLEKKIGKARLIAACQRAIHFNNYSYQVIKSILDKKLDLLQIQTSQQNQIDIPYHDNIRGATNYQ
ncbi:IS21 family transposase [Bacteroidota bacterium]